MKEIQGNIWDFHKQGHWVVITTNGSIRKDGKAVMGKGVAKEAAERFPGLAEDLGTRISHFGNHFFRFDGLGIATLPVKHRWMEKADFTLIEQSIKEMLETLPCNLTKVYMVRPGCGNGGLDWKDVKPILEIYLDDRFVIVEKEDQGRHKENDLHS